MSQQGLHNALREKFERNSSVFNSDVHTNAANGFLSGRHRVKISALTSHRGGPGSRSGGVEIVMDKVALWQVYSSSSVNRGWYNGPVSDRSTKR
jgi:hypothetical protein